MAHAKYSASSSKRWLNCPGSVALSANAPAQAPSLFADEGTEAHAALEAVMRAVFERNAKLEKELEELEVFFSKEVLGHVHTAVKEAFKFFHAEKGTEVLLEKKVDLSFVFPNTFGTVDIAYVTPFKRLSIVDYKHGVGVPVDAKENTQLLFYALGLAHEYDYLFEEIEIVIIQPRAEHADGPVRSWVISIDELISWKKIFEDGIARAEEKDAPLHSGEWCQFCPAKSFCPEISTRAMKQALIDFIPESGEIDAPNVEKMPLEFLPQALSAGFKLEKWIKAVRDRATQLLEEGKKVEGFKLVDKRAQKKWADPEKAGRYLRENFGDEVLNLELKSPAQIKKLIGKGINTWVKENTVEVSSGVTLASIDDPRPEALVSAAKDFAPQYGESWVQTINKGAEKIHRALALQEALKESKKRRGKNGK